MRFFFFSHVDVGDAFQVINQIVPPALSLFRLSDLGDAFQVINQIVPPALSLFRLSDLGERRHNTTSRGGVLVRRWRSNP